MSKKTIPVALLNFDRFESTRGLELHERNIPNHVIFGNKCFHSKSTPKEYKSPPHHKKKSDQIEKAKEGFKKFYFEKIKLFNRKIRSERREAIMVVGQCLIDYTDFVTGEVRNNISIKKLMLHTGLAFRRIIRALKALQKAGYIFMSRRWKQGENRFIGLTSLRVITDKLLFALGLTKTELDKLRKYKYNELQDKEIEAKSELERQKLIKEFTSRKPKSINKPKKAWSTVKSFTEFIEQMRLLKLAKT